MKEAWEEIGVPVLILLSAIALTLVDRLFQ